MKPLCRLPFMLMLSLLLIACTPQERMSTLEPSNTYFPISIDGTLLKLQLALVQSEQSKGLMHRESMPTDHGMLFLFNQPEPRSFWMRNTHILLDLGYFDASGRLLEIHALYPHDENGVPSHNQEVLIAIETNRGWFARNNIVAGAQIDLEALAQAMSRRGTSLDNYPIQTAY